MAPSQAMVFVIFTGFLVNQDNIPSFLFPLKFVALIRYAFQVLMYNEYDGLDLGCTTRDPIEVGFMLSYYNNFYFATLTHFCISYF